ncbi:hypothetical protein HRR80_000115 [Exophiala dermatitidis]|uniref:Uncharacterized protein n=1 Tax=Exophiala dermatitidis TaxID=5970 RepID=A0AAN6J2C3_EXODE|nr:hypothetical protein HRR73_002648 [Exophiala dermatitidis]KAJ4530922.1 hypothetical protein HRR76_008610 [Exophiala dermatitidis]KAJ4558093.1 hypothetical protein HRR77_000115 [Exophiala dermatitidis]KAJ4581878.1 hypothetical protein HRR79_000884 [Exophiala dermatitidis]KAJ4620882.1 hypothetical protein HRR85_001111 [Exophiala dermatitidis]
MRSWTTALACHVSFSWIRQTVDKQSTQLAKLGPEQDHASKKATFARMKNCHVSTLFLHHACTSISITSITKLRLVGIVGEATSAGDYVTVTTNGDSPADHGLSIVLQLNRSIVTATPTDRIRMWWRHVMIIPTRYHPRSEGSRASRARLSWRRPWRAVSNQTAD